MITTIKLCKGHTLRLSELLQIISCVLTQIPCYFPKHGNDWTSVDPKTMTNIGFQMHFLTLVFQICAVLSWAIGAHISGIRAM